MSRVPAGQEGLFGLDEVAPPPPAAERAAGPERSQNGSRNVRYRVAVEAAALDRLRALVAAHAPWLRIRYAF